jgi:hypothetical protein
MPAAEQGGQDPIDGVALAHHPLGHLGPKGAHRLGELIELLDIVVGGWGHG